MISEKVCKRVLHSPRFYFIFFYADDSKLIGNARLPKTFNYTNKVMSLETNQNAASSISIDKDKPGTGN